MQPQFHLSDPLSGRFSKSSHDSVSESFSAQRSESGKAVTRQSASIDIGNLPMVRKGGGTAIIFDRMDSNGNGILTRSELISYRLKPMSTETVIPVPPMPAETMKQVGEAVKAKISLSDQNGKQIPFLKNGTSLEEAFGVDQPDTGEDIALPGRIPDTATTPASLPESIVMAKAAAPVAAPPPAPMPAPTPAPSASSGTAELAFA